MKRKILVGLLVGVVIVVTGAREMSIVETTLQYVERMKNSNCTVGTANRLPMTISTKAWIPAAQIGVKMANFLSSLYVNRIDAAFTDDHLFCMTYSNVESQSLIFGSWAAYEDGVHNGYKFFVPYTFEMHGVMMQTVTVDYDYRVPENEWYMLPRNHSWDSIQYRELKSRQVNATADQVTRIPIVNISDGFWTHPYYDCGGGNIWMVSYTIPFFNVSNETLVFLGTTGVDIDLSNVDINQCDDGSESDPGTLNMFRGSHHCHPSTVCSFVAGEGFRRGSYECLCRNGFYRPLDPGNKQRFRGSEIETYWDEHIEEMNGAEWPYQCHPCSEGCATCVDDAPCVYFPTLAIQGVLLAINVLCQLLAIVIGILVRFYESRASIKSGSPLFLVFMCAGAVVGHAQIVVLFFHSLPVRCMISAWFSAVGFSMLFGSLLLKTWRIAKLCTITSTRLVAIADRTLLHRLCLIILFTAVLLSAWTATSIEKEQVRTARNGLLFYGCGFSWWQLSLQIAKTAFLFWGAYLCFSIRKAPSAFNESRYITWAIYNAALTGNFLFVSSYFLAWPEGPDVVFILEFLRTLVETLVTVLIIIVPKIYAINQSGAPSNGVSPPKSSKTVASTAVSHFVAAARMRKTTATQTDDSYLQGEPAIAHDVTAEPDSANPNPS